MRFALVLCFPYRSWPSDHPPWWHLSWSSSVPPVFDIHTYSPLIIILVFWWGWFELRQNFLKWATTFCIGIWRMREGKNGLWNLRWKVVFQWIVWGLLKKLLDWFSRTKQISYKFYWIIIPIELFPSCINTIQMALPFFPNIPFMILQKFWFTTVVVFLEFWEQEKVCWERPGL